MLPNTWLDNAADINGRSFSLWGGTSPFRTIAMALIRLDLTTGNCCASLRKLGSCRLPTSRRGLRTGIRVFLMSLAKLQRCPYWKVIHSSPDAWRLAGLCRVSSKSSASKLIRKDIFRPGTRRCWQPNWEPGQEDPRCPDGSDWKPSPNDRMMDIWSSSAG